MKVSFLPMNVREMASSPNQMSSWTRCSQLAYQLWSTTQKHELIVKMDDGDTIHATEPTSRYTKYSLNLGYAADRIAGGPLSHVQDRKAWSVVA